MQWYKHDTNSTQDAKIKKLLLKYGELGYSVYFHSLELIMGDADKDNLSFILEHDSEIIADNLKVKGTQDKSGIERVEDVMRFIIQLGLFQENEGIIKCIKLLNRLDASMSSNPTFRKRITEAKNRDTKLIEPSCQSHDRVMREEKREEERRREEKTENDLPNTPASFYKEMKDHYTDKEYTFGFDKFVNYFDKAEWKSKTGNSMRGHWQNRMETWQSNEPVKHDKIKFKTCPSCHGQVVESQTMCNHCRYDFWGE